MSTYTFTSPNSSAVYRGVIDHGAYSAEAIVAAVAACSEEPGRVETILSATHDRATHAGTVLRALRFGVSEDSSWRIDEGAGLDGPGSHRLAVADASTRAGVHRRRPAGGEGRRVDLPGAAVTCPQG